MPTLKQSSPLKADRPSPRPAAAEKKKKRKKSGGDCPSRGRGPTVARDSAAALPPQNITGDPLPFVTNMQLFQMGAMNQMQMPPTLQPYQVQLQQVIMQRMMQQQMELQMRQRMGLLAEQLAQQQQSLAPSPEPAPNPNDVAAAAGRGGTAAAAGASKNLIDLTKPEAVAATTADPDLRSGISSFTSSLKAHVIAQVGDRMDVMESLRLPVSDREALLNAAVRDFPFLGLVDWRAQRTARPAARPQPDQQRREHQQQQRSNGIGESSAAASSASSGKTALSPVGKKRPAEEEVGPSTNNRKQFAARVVKDIGESSAAAPSATLDKTPISLAGTKRPAVAEVVAASDDRKQGADVAAQLQHDDETIAKIDAFLLCRLRRKAAPPSASASPPPAAEKWQMHL